MELPRFLDLTIVIASLPAQAGSFNDEAIPFGHSPNLRGGHACMLTMTENSKAVCPKSALLRAFSDLFFMFPYSTMRSIRVNTMKEQGRLPDIASKGDKVSLPTVVTVQPRAEVASEALYSFPTNLPDVASVENKIDIRPDSLTVLPQTNPAD